jgi:signal transduction histidine kinase
MSYEDSINLIPEKYRVKNAAEIAIFKNKQYSIEYPVLGFRDNKQRWVRALGALYEDDTNNLSYFSGVIMDITEQKEDDIRKSKLIGMVSHELKTPITTLKAYVQMLEGWTKKKKDAFSMGILSKADRQVKKMNTIISGFLSIAQVDSGKIHLNKHEFNLKKLIQEAIEETLVINPKHTFTLSPCEDINIIADSGKIEQVIINLLANAVKYSPDSFMVEIACTVKDDQAQISVIDKGMGIKQKDINKLFKRYYRVKSKMMMNIPGFGIGLYLCAEIVKRHKGNIWVESELGKGSSFSFSLPLK